MNEVDVLVGRQVAAARRRRGLSQVAFAALIGRSESWVSKVETGVIRLDSLSLAQRIAELVGIPLECLLALEARTGHRQVPVGQGQTLKLMHLLINPRDWEMWDEVKRRWFFGQAAASVMTMLDLLRTHPAHAHDLGDRFESVRAGRVRLDGETVEGLEQATLGYRRAYRSSSAFSLIGPAYGTLNVLLELAPDAGEHHDRVVSMIGQMGALVGTMLMLDLGDFDSSRQYLAIAARAGQQIDDPQLLGFALGCRAFHASYSGNRRGGLGFARGALDLAGRGIHPVTRGWLSAVASEMHASSGEDRECEFLLDEAACHLGRTDLADLADPWLGIGVFNVDKLAAYRGGGLMRLGRYGEAQNALLGALGRLDPALRKHRCTAHIDLAEAFVLDRKIDDGAEHAIDALRIIESTRHADSLRRVEKLFTAVRPARTATVRRLGEKLIALKAMS
ncbi:Helix-turn-helix domain-containing protein [Nonomuraea solani]|uniref:Helix-turn-helix domain-containing protein n=1 Tax=Nonomuraea solani TaxID=1144553 RepID=A0A1H6EXT8_9ACTN|nr:helix-turn-helix transcriptional regulator [Nonomuraea solani]SEH01776.1 Helix-turn-helix domain-containing protein [Nonomuraea solani]